MLWNLFDCFYIHVKGAKKAEGGWFQNLNIIIFHPILTCNFYFHGWPASFIVICKLALVMNCQLQVAVPAPHNI
jgi:hypothetical protein